MVDQEFPIADDPGSAITATPSVKFTESFRDMDKISIHEPTDGKPYPSLCLDPPFKNSLANKWSTSIILQLVGIPIAFDVLMEKIKCLWKLERKLQFIDIGDNCFVFNSDCESTRLKILSDGPWIVNEDCYLLPRTWIPQFCSSRDKITSAIARVRIMGLPVELYDDTVLFGIAKMLGRPIELDYGTNCSASGRFARLSVEIDLDKPLRTFVMVEEMMFSVEYKNFSVICNKCGKIGHRNEDCSVNLVNRPSRDEQGVKEVTPAEEMFINVVNIAPSSGPRMQVGFKRKRGDNTSSVLEEDKPKKIKDEDHASEKLQEEEVSKSEDNLYTVVKVALDKHLKAQIGKDVYFDLVNLDKVSSFRVLKQMPFYQFKEEVSKKLGIPVQYMRFWKWAKRQNLTYRPHRPLTPPEQVQSVAQLMGVSKNLDLFLEVEYGDLLHPIPYPIKSNEDILIFLKLYDPYKEKIGYVGRLFVKGYATPAEIIPKLKELAGFSSVDDIELYEEVRFEPAVMCECLDKSFSITSTMIEDGDIICFQKCLPPDAEKHVRFPDVPSFLKYVKNLQIVRFRALERPKEDGFCLELAKNHTYDDVVERVAKRLCLDDPSRIRLTGHSCYSQQPKPDYIKYRSVDHLLDMLVHYNQISDVLYYEVLDIPLPELQDLKTLKVAFQYAMKNEIVVHNISLPKQSTVEDILNKIKTKVKLSNPDAELRLLEIFHHKIYKIFSLHERIENLNDKYWTLRAEEIPEEERNLGPHERLINVYHFTKVTAQNIMQVQNFGEPFLFTIHEWETLGEVKTRIQKKLQVADKEFSKWKIAFITLGSPEYLRDMDIVSSRFLNRDVYGEWEQYLGLEHYDTSP